MRIQEIFPILKKTLIFIISIYFSEFPLFVIKFFIFLIGFCSCLDLMRAKNILIAFVEDDPIVQRIGHSPAKTVMQVRFLLGSNDGIVAEWSNAGACKALQPWVQIPSIPFNTANIQENSKILKIPCDGDFFSKIFVVKKKKNRTLRGCFLGF